MNNPELRRLLWLECTPARVAAVLGTLVALLGLGWLIDGRSAGPTTARFALAGFVVCTLAWGAMQAGASVLDELRQRTWDQQRMSALTPWEMTWGKLAGAGALPWLGGALALGVYAWATHEPDLPWRLLLLAAAALLLQGLALGGALLLLQRGGEGRSSPLLRTFGALAVLWIAWSFTQRGGGRVEWFGAVWATTPFTALTVLSLAGWAVFGSQRLMCEALQVRTLPWALPAFIVHLGLLVAGFFVDGDTAPLARRLIVTSCGLLASLGCAYFCAFALKTEPLLPRRLAVAWRTGDRARVLETLPAFAVALATGALFAAATQFAAGTAEVALPAELLLRAPAGALPLFLYGLRDLIVLFGLRVGAAPGRFELFASLYLVVAYWLLPGLAAFTGLPGLGRALAPLPWLRPTEATLILLGHAALAAAWAGLAYRRRSATPGAP